MIFNLFIIKEIEDIKWSNLAHKRGSWWLTVKN